MRWASIIPLIGGETLGCYNVFKTFPEYILSYSVFKNNDKHVVKYLKDKGWNGKYYLLDSPDDASRFLNEYKDTEIDVVNAVPPCGGLSSLSIISNSDNEINDWMYKTASYVLSNIKPKIYFGENAWYLATEKGRGVADNLYHIGLSNNYSFLIFQTETRFLGNPQKRPRAFFFFFNKDYFSKLPLINEIEKNFVNYRDFINKEVLPDDKMNVFINEYKVSDSPWYECINEIIKTDSYIDFVDKVVEDNNGKDVNLVKKCLSLYKNNLDKLINWMRSHGYEHEAKRVERIKVKFDSGKGAWLHDIIVGKYQIPGFVVGSGSNKGSSAYLAHPTEDRFLTVREMLRLMGLPDDFNMNSADIRKDITHVSQNVCVHSAELMAEYIMDIFNNNIKKWTNCDYVIQKHKNNDIEFRSHELSMEDFI